MELLIRTQHKQPHGSVLHEIASQRGDIITIQSDGWQWSEAERNHPDWIIITCELWDDDCIDLMEAGREGEPNWRRRIGVEVDGLQSGDVLTRDQLMTRTF